jgi:glyoxalase family protein
MSTHGIHHVTGIAGNPQRNVDFYVGVLGLRLVKKTVNFDDPTRYHFYYGDGLGSPGTVVTFFAWDTRNNKGRPGTGQVTTTSFSVPDQSLDAWSRRLEAKGFPSDGPQRGFGGQESVRVRDADGLEVELVATPGDTRPGWSRGIVPPCEAIRGLYGVSLSLAECEGTEQLLSGTLGFRKVAEDGDRTRYEAGQGGAGNTVDLLHRPDAKGGRTGIGTNHHVAWRVVDDAAQQGLRAALLKRGNDVSEVMDRTYFRSIYFREPGGVLFEAATDPPGFDVDEERDRLGSELKLPSWLEPRRTEIEAALPPVVDPSG